MYPLMPLEKSAHSLKYENTDSTVPIQEQIPFIISNSVLTIVAGSDTTSTTLCAILCCVLSHPDVYSKLRQELGDAFEVIDETTGFPKIEFEKLLKLPYLSAVVYVSFSCSISSQTDYRVATETKVSA
jgi:Cytochrome P450